MLSSFVHAITGILMAAYESIADPVDSRLIEHVVPEDDANVTSFGQEVIQESFVHSPRTVNQVTRGWEGFLQNIYVVRRGY